MRRVGLSLVCVVLTASAVWAQRTVTFQKLQVGDTAVGLLLATTNPVGRAQIAKCAGAVETGEIRVVDLRGATVAATTGRIIGVGAAFDLVGNDFATNARFVKTGSTTGVVNIECWSE